MPRLNCGKCPVQWFFEQYFGAIGKDPHDPHISPIYADNLFGLPPAFILSAEVRGPGLLIRDYMKACNAPCKQFAMRSSLPTLGL